MKEWLKKNSFSYLAFIFANVISAINFNLLMKPINLVAGGSAGLSLILEKYFHISTSNLITIIYIIAFILSSILLGKKAMIGIIFGSVLYPLFIYLTEGISSIIFLSYNDIFLIIIISGVISGISNGITYRFGFASGGIGVIPPIMSKYFKLSISSTSFFLNSSIVIIGGIYYGFNMVLYAIVLLYISRYICNSIILGVSTHKAVFVKTNKKDEVLNLITQKYHSTATIMDSEDDDLFLTIVHNNNYLRFKEDIKEIDKKIFFSTENCYEVRKIN